MASPASTHEESPTDSPSVPQRVRRPLQREGAFYSAASAAELAMEAAMNRSSSPGPEETALGKRAREGDHPGDQDDTEPDDDESAPTTTALQSPPSLSNITAATLRYASKKKLRPEQRDELEDFLSVSLLVMSFLQMWLKNTGVGHSTWSAGQVVCLYSFAGEQGRCFSISYTAISAFGRIKSTNNQLFCRI